MGTAETDAELQMRARPPAPGQARLFTAYRGITARARPHHGPDLGRYRGASREAVQDLAAKKVDIVKVWVDDRDGKYPKMTPALYGAVIDEAHKAGLRVTAHIFTLEDAKGLLRAGSMRSPTACVTAMSTMNSWRWSRRVRTSWSTPTSPTAVSKPTSPGCGKPSGAEMTKVEAPTPTARRRSRPTVSRRAISPSSAPPAPKSCWHRRQYAVGAACRDGR